MTQNVWIFVVKNPQNIFITSEYQAIYLLVVLTWKETWRHKGTNSSVMSNPMNCSILPRPLRPHSHWVCLGVCEREWGQWRGRRQKCGKSAAICFSSRAGRSCIGQSQSTEWGTWISSERNETGTGGTETHSRQTPGEKPRHSICLHNHPGTCTRLSVLLGLHSKMHTWYSGPERGSLGQSLVQALHSDRIQDLAPYAHLLCHC